MKTENALWDVLVELEGESALPFELQEVMDAARAKVESKSEQ